MRWQFMFSYIMQWTNKLGNWLFLYTLLYIVELLYYDEFLDCKSNIWIHKNYVPKSQLNMV